MADRNYTPHQEKIIKRYYKNYDSIKVQRLSELVSDLYLTEGKKQDRIWKQVAEALTKLEFPPARIEHLLQRKDPALIVGILGELEGKKS
ncbi:hypothetical protein BH23PLA1_BH23PLA1_04180 [soil metagenome]